MRNVWLLAKREYLERVRTRAFVIFTLLTPAFMFCVTVLPAKMAIMRGSKVHLVVVASDEAMGNAIRDRLLLALNRVAAGSDVEVSTDTSDGGHDELVARVQDGSLEGFLWATNDAIARRSIAYDASSTSDFVKQEVIQNSLQQAVLRAELLSRGITRSQAEELLKPIKLEIVTIRNGKSGNTNALAGGLSGLFMLMLMYTSVLIYGMNVMRSVLEEKSSRILEVLLSTATAQELMAGKILGVGAVGLTQIGIWGILSAVYLVPAGMSGGLSMLHLSGWVWIAFAAFFLLGYFLYSAVCGAVGACLNSEQEAQQVNFIVVMPLIFSVLLGIFVLRQPDHPLSVFFSMVPFCAPILMLVRIVLEPVPFWQIGLSVGLMIATIYLMVALCSKIYRVGILMYGKRPTLPEILKWLKYN